MHAKRTLEANKPSDPSPPSDWSAKHTITRARSASFPRGSSCDECGRPLAVITEMTLVHKIKEGEERFRYFHDRAECRPEIPQYNDKVRLCDQSVDTVQASDVFETDAGVFVVLCDHTGFVKVSKSDECWKEVKTPLEDTEKDRLTVHSSMADILIDREGRPMEVKNISFDPNDVDTGIEDLRSIVLIKGFDLDEYETHYGSLPEHGQFDILDLGSWEFRIGEDGSIESIYCPPDQDFRNGVRTGA